MVERLHKAVFLHFEQHEEFKYFPGAVLPSISALNIWVVRHLQLNEYKRIFIRAHEHLTQSGKRELLFKAPIVL